jgi:futalosine hydrolase
MRVLLACATPQECQPLIPGNLRPGLIGGRQAYALSPQATVVVCGVGKVNTAQALTAALEGGHGFQALISFGSAGAFLSSGLAPGDLAVASEEVTDELVVLPGGLASLAEIDLPLAQADPPLYNRFPVDAKLSGRILEACRRATPGGRVASGPLLTASRITSSRAEAERLENLFGPLLCESMEGAAAAQVAHHYGLPFAELRAVSNLIDDRERQRWDFAAATQACCRALSALLEDL